ncbi:MAG: hypothetical protein NZM17_06320 [Pyrinomonadaceae bacterium]|nr:hypothetical protein [Pyrinomonadaceae bacterium]
MEKSYRDFESEVSSLQLVDYIFSSIEKGKGANSDERFNVSQLKSILHDFSKAIQSENREKTSEIEEKIEEQIELWYLSLAQRDKKIMPSEFRLYCENSKPPLSPQALVSLIRFYTGLPFSEHIRSKLDVLVTKLFSTQTWNKSRELVASTDEIRMKFEGFYKEWANAPLFSEQKDEVLARFREFVERAKNFNTLGELLQSGIHSELLNFKASLGEEFLAPYVLAASVDCNVSFGNHCVELVLREKEVLGAEAVKSRYGASIDDILSEAIAKTFNVADIVDAKREEVVRFSEPETQTEILVKKKPKKEKKKQEITPFIPSFSFTITNKWLLVVLFLTIGLALALYVYVEFGMSGVTKKNVEIFQIENTEFQGYLKAGRISNELLIGVVTDKWKTLNDSEKKAMVEKLVNVGKQRNFSKVFLLNNNGLTVAEAYEGKVEIYDR